MMDTVRKPRRILLQSGLRDADGPVARLAAALRDIGVEADHNAALAPDLAPYDLIHVIDTLERTTGPASGTPQIPAAVRQVLRARSWGLPVVLSATVAALKPHASDTLARHLEALRALIFQATDLLLVGPEAAALATPVPISGSGSGAQLRTRVVHFAFDDARGVPANDDDWRRAAEETWLGYEDAMRAWRARAKGVTNGMGAMGVTEQPGDDEANHVARPPWLPDLPPDEYIAHLESLIQLQLEAIALRDARHADFRDAQYAQLLANHRGLEESYRALEEGYLRIEEGFPAHVAHVRGLEAGLEAEQRERARVEEAYRVLEANARGQGDYIARLEAALAETHRSPFARLISGRRR